MVRDVRDMRLKTREREREGERENIYLIRGHVCVCVYITYKITYNLHTSIHVAPSQREQGW